MCYSATASFSLGLCLISIGTYSVNLARKQPDLRSFSFIPIFFGIQQCLEGFVWIFLNEHHRSLTQFFGYAYLFFALAFWPSYIPFTLHRLEKNSAKKAKIKKILYLGLGLSALLYCPVLLGYIPLAIKSISDSLNYTNYNDTPILFISNILYGFVVTYPMFISSRRYIHYFGGSLLFSLILSYFFLYYAFTSLWCFFAAILSVFIIYILETELRENQQVSSLL